MSGEVINVSVPTTIDDKSIQHFLNKSVEKNNIHGLSSETRGYYMSPDDGGLDTLAYLRAADLKRGKGKKGNRQRP